MAIVSPTGEFYRKPLPSSCIDFASAEGKEIFKEAMCDGTMNCFFHLAAQFRTQEEPAYCGLSTLVMVLNALSVDPGRVWKGPWRWYHENMLDCCVPLDVAKKHGITLCQFSCLAACNGLKVDMVQALPSVPITQFRDVVRRISECNDHVLVCSYSRKTLGQTGGGHFSPIGGYHAGRDLVLIFDVARFKYPPHWVPVHLLLEAMRALDDETGQPRGYLVLSPALHIGNPTVLFRVSKTFDLTSPLQLKPEVLEVFHRWQEWLTSQCHSCLGKEDFFEILVTNFFRFWCSDCFAGFQEIVTIKIDLACCQQLSENHKCAIKNVLHSLEHLSLFYAIEKSLNCFGEEQLKYWEGNVSISVVSKELCCPFERGDANLPEIKLSHFAAMVLIAWPYQASSSLDKTSNLTYGDLCLQFMKQELSVADKVLENEVALLNAQLETIFSYYKTNHRNLSEEGHVQTASQAF